MLPDLDMGIIPPTRLGSKVKRNVSYFLACCEILGDTIIIQEDRNDCYEGMKNLRLRKATVDDSEFAYQTKKLAFREYAEKVWGWDEDEQRQLHERRFAAQDFRVIQVSGIDVGILAVVQLPDCVKVNQMFIMPGYQSKGIGSACISRIIEDTTGSKLPIRLQVLKVNNRAAAFYRRWGFRIIGETDTHVLMERLS